MSFLASAFLASGFLGVSLRLGGFESIQFCAGFNYSIPEK
jgi:hypothetical protein